MVDITQEQVLNRVNALLADRLALAQQAFTEEIWRIGDDFNAKGMLGGSAFHTAILSLGESAIRKAAGLIEDTWREALSAFKEVGPHLESGFLSKHAEERLREYVGQIESMTRSIETNKNTGLLARLEEQLSRSVGSLTATLEIMLAELRPPSGEPLQLEDEQHDLLARFVEAHRSTPAESRGTFFASSSRNQPQATFVHSRVHGLTFRGSMSDAEILAHLGLLRVSYSVGNKASFSVLPQGINAYEKRRGSSPPLDTVSAEPQKFLSGAEFRTTHAAAFAKWEQAARLLWAADSPQNLTTIGHLCREALQAFAASLAQERHVDVSTIEPAKTVARLKAVMATCETGGTTRRKVLSALIDYWGSVSDLVQRQEHGAQREGEPLVWEDARCVVFQSCVLMFEAARGLR